MFRDNLRAAAQKYLSVSDFHDKWERDQRNGSGYFYSLTYNPILSFFKEHQSLSSALALKIALIFSWNPKICEVTLDRLEQAKRELADLEESTGKELITKDILSVDIDKIIKELWFPVKRATSSSDSTSGVSVTKFLHFSFPHIFPMIDSNTMGKLGGASVNLKWYSIFLSEWKSFYGHSKESFEQISNAENIPTARVLDVMLFNPR